jgi:hypothetical protein
MSEINVLEQDLSNFVTDVIKDVRLVFSDIIKGASYAEEIISHIMTDAIPVAETVVSVIDPAALNTVKMVSQILGNAKASAENTVTIAQSIENLAVLPGSNLSVETAKANTQNAVTAYNATVASIENISADLSAMVKKAVVTVPKAS